MSCGQTCLIFARSFHSSPFTLHSSLKMWFIVNTNKFQEQKTKEFLENTYSGIVKLVYLPKCRMKYVDAKGEERFRFRPMICGLLFIKADSVKALKRILTYWGYFVYEDTVRNLETGELQKKKLVSTAHLLCKDVKDLNLDAIIKNATIPDEDMEHFIYFCDKMADGIEGLSIVDKRYDDLILENDTIRIFSGPLKGWVGVVKQIKRKGKKDRHLFVRFGNNHCLNVSNIRQYDMQIEHEATKGPKAEAVGVWRAIDQMIGYLQAKQPSENAYETLRNLFLDYQKRLTGYRNRRMTDEAYNNKKEEKTVAQQQKVLDQIDKRMRNNFRILSKNFPTGEIALGECLEELIPDAKLRPFLTPTSGGIIPEGQNFTVLCHNGITELILRCNLRDVFLDKDNESDKNTTVFDEDYEYDAHFALVNTDGGKVKAICSWGGFYDYYASQSEDEREKFHTNLEAKKYPRLLYLLTQSEYKFEKVNGIGGFSIETDIVYTEDMEELGRRANEFFTLRSSLFTQLTAAAVEIWKGTRLLVWRQLLQRYVLLHKVPVIDQVPYDSK